MYIIQAFTYCYLKKFFILKCLAYICRQAKQVKNTFPPA